MFVLIIYVSYYIMHPRHARPNEYDVLGIFMFYVNILRNVYRQFQNTRKLVKTGEMYNIVLHFDTISCPFKR